ncbi:INO80 complex subunit C [Armadillidium nasatum]|uniref:INO80 complex subunit C n=1 Tax=Armadillidium nasatum TaxID=96803 RepID=A0A5N5TQ82_9CRUS|nr:INO80 complex subunit C [Armadillidium nasatum]
MVAAEEQNEEKLTESKIPVFHNPNFKHSAIRFSKKRVWKNLKQILALEKSYIWPTDAVHYSNIEAPPSFTPAKKYSDVSGLPANYTDPLTKLRYANSSEFQYVRGLSMDIVNGLLEIRKANSIV